MLGSRLLEPIKTSQVPALGVPDSVEAATKFTMTVKGVTASGRRTAEGFLVFRGSGASNEPAPALPVRYANLRQTFIDQGKIAPDPTDRSRLTFTDDVLFSSPSAAACVVAGSSRNGFDIWLADDGRSLRTVEESEIGSLT